MLDPARGGEDGEDGEGGVGAMPHIFLRLQEGYDGADEVQRLVRVDPVAGVRDVLDVGAGEQPMDLRVVLRATRTGRGGRDQAQREKDVDEYPHCQK